MTPEQKGPPPASVAVAAAAAGAAVASRSQEHEDDNDAASTGRLHAVDRVVQEVFGFDETAAQRTADEVGTDVTTTACLGHNVVGEGEGGAADHPIDKNCPHTVNHVNLTHQQLPKRPHTEPCSHYSAVAASEASAAFEDQKPESSKPDRKRAKPDSNGNDEIGDHHDGDDEGDEDDDDDDEDDEDDEDDDENLFQIIAAAASARGIPLEFIVEHAEAQAGFEPDDVEYPFGKLPNSLRGVADFILSDKCRRVLILAGAGMSVSSGIPDFRSSNGLYATMNPDLLTADRDQREAIRDDPTVALDQTLFLRNPLPCLELNREFILGTRSKRWKATLAHRFVELLHAKTNKLVRLYTQNIDGLENQCQKLPRDKIVAVHGSMDRAECARCRSEADFPSFCDAVQRQIKDLSGKDATAPLTSAAIDCRVCGCNTMKPSIVLFRSTLPKEFFDRVPRDVEDVDLLIVMGTSLCVAPANSLVWRVPQSSMRLLVNREEVGRHLGMRFPSQPRQAAGAAGADEDDPSSNSSGSSTTSSSSPSPLKRDYFAQGSCDEVLLDLMQHLGWLDDLKPLLDGQQLPDSCAELLRKRIDNALGGGEPGVGAGDESAKMNGQKEEETGSRVVAGFG